MKIHCNPDFPVKARFEFRRADWFNPGLDLVKGFGVEWHLLKRRLHDNPCG